MEALHWLRVSLLAGAISALALHVAGAAAAEVAVCGDGVVSGDEECDDGGICTGGNNAGQACTAESDCTGNGVCFGGTKSATGCAADIDCPEGACVHCTPYGGDGCASNCTTEADVSLTFLPGQTHGGVLASGTSGAMVYGSITVPLPLEGHEILTVGKRRNGSIPGVIKAEHVNIPRVQVGDIGCACVRAVAVKTCGGTLFEPDGVTLSKDCTDTFTAGAALCPSDKPCSFVHGPGNAASGIIGCDGLAGVDITYTQDCNDVPGSPAKDPVITFSGAGGPGSAVLLASIAVGTQIGSCSGSGAAYGADGEYCTDDDPFEARGTPATLPITTGAASATIHNAFDTPGADNGPFVANGLVFDCGAIENHIVEEASLVGSFTLCDQPTVGDAALINAFVIGPNTPPPPTHTPTPSPTPSPVCVGDCGKDGAVTADELLIMVNVALGNTGVASCLAGDGNGDGEITVDEILKAVKNALSGCEMGLGA